MQSSYIKSKKNELRQKYLKIRDNFNPDYIKSSSLEISKTLFKLNDYKIAKNIFIFLSMKNEFITEYIIKNSLSLNKNVFVPVLSKVKGEMLFSQINNNTKFKYNQFNTLEPKEVLNPTYFPTKETLILVPAIVYSKEKFRIGYGGGYYDRFLSKSTSLANVGVCFDKLVINHFEVETFDKKVDYIITEEKIIN